MKKIIAGVASIGTYISLFVKPALADVNLNIQPPKQGYKDLGEFVGNVLNLAFGFAVLVVLVMLVWGAFEWISSGGDKDAVGKARGRIINALIGLAVLAVAYALAKVAAQFLGFGSISNIKIPEPSST